MCPEPRAARASSSLLCALAAALLAGCAVPPPAPPPPPPAAAPVPPPPAVAPPTAPPAESAVPLPVQGGQPGGVRTDNSTVAQSLLLYADRVRRMAPAELAQEVTRLSDIAEAQRQPAEEMQLAITLAQTRVPADLVRAQGLAQRVLGNPREEARGLYPLAGMLVARYAEQRRVEEALDRQAQQLREQQRRIDQLSERLEAVRAIERSLTSRPPPNGGHRAVQP
ncbi:hypothetical protein [Pseudorhodoferax sp. Leaf274]|uniref:hypothetical protein n=1 Tax=Pseudorhodoferax sp. Leaf274 TaxID=1736318 RepID=UPI0007036119|nr:hypothetical protein [Pseudorhodoferax sp. Leaf274]KQP48664.1 hypothetical protein ASF44_22480 [Pseudorhodoferax sp. Leaf274]